MNESSLSAAGLLLSFFKILHFFPRNRVLQQLVKLTGPLLTIEREYLLKSFSGSVGLGGILLRNRINGDPTVLVACFTVELACS